MGQPIVIYVAGPYRGDTPWDVEQNIRRAEELGLEVAKLGAIPLIPHTQYRFYQGQLPDSFWIEGTLELLRRCNGAIFHNRWPFSKGSKGERVECHRLEKPVFDTIAELKDWLDRQG